MPDYPGAATSLNNLVGVYGAQGKYAEAEPLFKRTLTIVVRTLGLEHPFGIQSLENYAVFLRETGRDAEAAELANRAKAIRAKQAGQNR